MSDHEGVGLRETVQELSRKMDTFSTALHSLTSTLAVYVEKLTNHQSDYSEGMKRLGGRIDKHDERLHAAEIASAAEKPKNENTGRWVERILLFIIGAALSALAVKLGIKP